MVAISPRAEEEGRIRRREVLARKAAHMPLHRHLAGVHRQAVDRAIEPGFLRHVDEQVVDAGGTDFGEHLATVGIGQGEVAHVNSLSPPARGRGGETWAAKRS